MTDTVLELRDVWFSFRNLPVLEGVNLTLRHGEYLALLGPNGGGKTTLVRLILGLLTPDRGTIRVLGKPPAQAHGQVGYVPQRAAFDLDFPIRVHDVVEMGQRWGNGSVRARRAQDRERTRLALERVAVAELADRPIGSLSGGQLQRVLLARALALEPRLLLLDEPTASLDERIERSVWELIEELSREVSVVLVSHDIGAISRTVRSVACLNRRLFGHPSQELTAEVLEATYGCPVELLAHGHPHRVLLPHAKREQS